MMLIQNARKARRNPARVVTPGDRQAVSQLRDPELIARCLMDEAAAWCELFERYHDRLKKRVSNRRGVRTVLASDGVDDVLGDLYLRILENDMEKLRAWHEGTPRGSLLALLTKIANGIAVDHIRHAIAGSEASAELGDRQSQRDADPNRGADWYAIQERNMRDPIKRKRNRKSKDDQ